MTNMMPRLLAYVQAIEQMTPQQRAVAVADDALECGVESDPVGLTYTCIVDKATRAYHETAKSELARWDGVFLALRLGLGDNGPVSFRLSDRNAAELLLLKAYRLHHGLSSSRTRRDPEGESLLLRSLHARAENEAAWEASFRNTDSPRASATPVAAAVLPSEKKTPRSTAPSPVPPPPVLPPQQEVTPMSVPTPATATPSTNVAADLKLSFVEGAKDGAAAGIAEQMAGALFRTAVGARIPSIVRETALGKAAVTALLPVALILLCAWAPDVVPRADAVRAIALRAFRGHTTILFAGFVNDLSGFFAEMAAMYDRRSE